MGDLFARSTAQQQLLDAWRDVRRRALEDDRFTETYQHFERSAADRLSSIARELRDGTWRPDLVRPVNIPKGDGSTRRLGISSLEDRIVERAMLDVLDAEIDPRLLPWSFGFRKGLGVRDAIACLVEHRDEGGRFVVRTDVNDCFAEIPRSRMLDRLADLVDDAELVELVRLLVYRPEHGQDESSPLGLHQGSALSPLLANVYLDQFDREMLDSGYRVIRYADDLAIVCTHRSETALATTVAAQTLGRLGMTLGPDKTMTCTFDEGVPFLGQVVTSGTGTAIDRHAHPQEKTIYINEEGGLLRSRGDRLRLERDGVLVLSASFERVRQVVIFGRVGMTTPFVQHVLERGIDVTFVSNHGRYIGRLQPASTANPFIRQAQHRALNNEDVRIALAGRMVRAKLLNLRGALQRGRRRREGGDALTTRIDRLERAAISTERQTTLNALMGVEGSGSREYFAGFGALLKDPWVFTTRQRRPPPDPVNSLLSFGYTLLVQESIAACEAAGLDAYSGFLHHNRVGRPSLALDLAEEFRPVIVDSVVLRMLNTMMLTPDSFETDPGRARPHRVC